MRWIYISILSILYSNFSSGQVNTTQFKSPNSILSLQMLQTDLVSQDILMMTDHQVISDLLAQGKIEVLRRLNNKQWVVRVLHPFSDKEITQIKALDPVNNLWKLSDELLMVYKANDLKGNKYTITGPSKIELVDILDAKGVEYSLINHYERAKTTHLYLPEASHNIISKLLAINDVLHIGIQKGRLRAEAVLNFHDLTVNKVNKAHHTYPTINGDAITVSVKEDHFDIADIDIRSRTRVSGIESETVSSHATDMATIIGGAGNSFYKGKGAAWGVDFTSSSFENILPDDDDIFDNLSISVQNHSYGFTVTDNQYGAEAMAYDVSTNVNKEVLHVFSAGNIGLNVTDHGIYDGVEGYANLSGNFKMAKNVLIVGAVDELYQVNTQNSRGPAYDGRVKPELVAFGKAGTSEGAAMVSGSSALLQQQYLEKQGSMLPSALLKAILIAGADDVGAEGIDFITGYGNMNIYKSMQVLESQQYESGLVTKGGETIIDLVVPINVKEAKVVLVWNDPAANAGDAAALVNNLDLTLAQADPAMTWLPWVLDSSPDANLLSLPATRKKDNLNNVEVITIEDPSSGIYQIKIDASGLMTDDQQYHIAYLFEYVNDFEWSYPVGTDQVIGGEQTYIRWESNIAEFSSIEVSYDGGATWEVIDSNVAIEQGYLSWDVPDVSGKAQLRSEVNGSYMMSEEFIVAPILDVSVGFDCDDSFMLTWNNMDNTTSYKVYEVGDKYLQLVEEVTDTIYVFNKLDFSDLNYAIAPVLNGSYEGNPSLAFNYQQQGINCYYRNFFVNNVFNQYLEIESNMSSTYGVKALVFERSTDSVNYEIVASVQPTFSQLSYTYNDEAPLTDFSYYRAYIVLEDGTEISAGVAEAFFPNSETIIISPNPIEQGDFFDISSKGDGRLLELLDLKGKVLREWDLESNFTTYEMSDVLKGMYLLRITNGDKTYGVKRLVVY